jgi:Undecaprenyl-phosphate glucose phosphotransferase
MWVSSDITGDRAAVEARGTTTLPRFSVVSSALDNAIGVPCPAQIANFTESNFSSSWLLSSVETFVLIVWSIATGVAYHRLVLGITSDISVFTATGVLVALIFCGSERLFRSERHIAAHRKLELVLQTSTFWFVSFLILSFFSFSFRISQEFSRGAVLVFFFTGLPILFLARRGTTKVFARQLYKNSLRWSDAVIVGCSQRALADTTEVFRARGCVDPKIVDIDASCTNSAWPLELERSIRQTTGLAHRAGPGAIYACAQDFPKDRFQMLLTSLQMIPRAVRIIPDAATAHLLSFPLRNDVDGISVEVQGAPLTTTQRALKRSFDLFASLVLVCILLPFFSATALAIKLDSQGPIFFRQTRLGYRGRPFVIFKLRTMHVLENDTEVQQAKKEDHRVTRIGKFLRRRSLDELPQLLNVIRGEMSLVGPRPHASAHDRLYASIIQNYELRQHVKPGITGWAQVYGLRGETASPDLMSRRVEFDIWYAKNASLALDAEILLRTVAVVLGQENAY